MGSRKDNGAETPGERIFGRIDTNWFGLFTEEMWRRKEDALSLFVPKNSDTGSDTRKKRKFPGPGRHTLVPYMCFVFSCPEQLNM